MHQHRLLADDTELGAQRYLGEAADVLTVDQDAALLDVEQAQHQVDDGRLARAGRTDERDPLARPDVEGKVMDDAAFLAIVERDVLEPDVAPGARHDDGVGRVAGSPASPRSSGWRPGWWQSCGSGR